MKNIEIRKEIGRRLIEELGGIKEVNACLPRPITQPSISNFALKGLPASREEYFRVTRPDLKVWRDFAPYAGLK
jgi:hypothetical protein